jgi:aspartyl-tRNA(Asn)/glutamyl-tRNA(Gln) amidotransferase subunit C
MAGSPVNAEVPMRSIAPGADADPVTPQVFEHLVQLAALELSPQEAEYLRREMNGQLAAIRELEAIDLPDDLPITSHGVPYTPAISQPLREDQVRPSGQAEAILAQAPEVEDRYLVVPDIPRTELE